jgi:hypothetical protein
MLDGRGLLLFSGRAKILHEIRNVPGTQEFTFPYTLNCIGTTLKAHKNI